MKISDEAVEAAAKAGHEARHGWGWDSLDGPTREAEIFAARFALESAAPHLHHEPSAASAWDEAATVLYMGNAIGQQVMQAMSARNPYRSQS